MGPGSSGGGPGAMFAATREGCHHLEDWHWWTEVAPCGYSGAALPQGLQWSRTV